jgi:lipoate-protein ligase A
MADQQDQGNTNFSIIMPRLLFTRSHGANLVARAVRERLGVKECTVNERNDVTIRDEVKGKDFKVNPPEGPSLLGSLSTTTFNL